MILGCYVLVYFSSVLKNLGDFRIYVCIVGYQLACQFLGWVVGHTGGFFLSGH